MYDLKKIEEIAWFALVAAGVFLLELLVRFDPDTVTDWQTWAISLASGMLRAAAGAALARITKP